MSKKIAILKDFSGGINAVQDPRDIKENQFSYITNFYLDEVGALRPSGSLSAHAGLVSNKSIGTCGGGTIENSGGSNLFYFETDTDVSLKDGASGAIEFHTGGEEGNTGGSAPPFVDSAGGPLASG